MKIDLPTPETDLVDTYTGLSLRVPKARGFTAHEVTSVRVSLTVIQADSPPEDLRAGDILADVVLHGYPLTAKGVRSKSAGRTQIFGLRDEETRWEIARTALLASCERHGLDPTKIVDHPIGTFAESLITQPAKETEINTDAIRMAMVPEMPAELAAAVVAGEPTWDTAELQRDFLVIGFAAPFVVVERKSDGVKGSLKFAHAPRFYFGFQAD